MNPKHRIPLCGPSRLGRLIVLMAVLAATVALGACRDSLTDLPPGLVAEESHAALVLGVAFADPGALLGENAGEADLAALARWRTSWDMPAEQGREARQAVYGDLAKALATTLSNEALLDEVGRLGEGVLRAKSLAGADAPERLRKGIEAADRDHTAARSALVARDPVGAVRHLLRAEDGLREVGPQAVARALVGDTEERLRRISEGDAYSQRDVERIRRLVRGAREAVNETDWVLAIRRAYYARGLLDGNG